MDPHVELLSALRDLLMPHDSTAAVSALLQTLAISAVVQLRAQGDMHKITELKAALVSDLEDYIDIAIQGSWAHEDTFRRN